MAKSGGGSSGGNKNSGGSKGTSGGSKSATAGATRNTGGKSTTATAREGSGNRATMTANTRTGVATISKSGTNPGYSAFSMKGLTSSDPANVARNRAAAAKYAAQDRAREAARGNAADRSDQAMPGVGPAMRPAEPPGQMMRRTFQGGPPPGYDPSTQGEWNYYKSERVDIPTAAAPAGGSMMANIAARRASNPTTATAPTNALGGVLQKNPAIAFLGAATGARPMKEGGAVKAKPASKPGMRGCGCATKGTKGGKMR